MRCGACGTRLSQSSHPGGAGAPPGPITRSCQELADDLGVALLAFGLLERFDDALPASGLFERDVLTGKRGPALNNRRDWRAERRPRVRKDTSHRFAHFGAPSPLILRKAEGLSRRIDEGP
jgi:hypothetical protein